MRGRMCELLQETSGVFPGSTLGRWAPAILLLQYIPLYTPPPHATATVISCGPFQSLGSAELEGRPTRLEPTALRSYIEDSCIQHVLWPRRTSEGLILTCQSLSWGSRYVLVTWEQRHSSSKTHFGYQRPFPPPSINLDGKRDICGPRCASGHGFAMQNRFRRADPDYKKRKIHKQLKLSALERLSWIWWFMLILLALIGFRFDLGSLWEDQQSLLDATTWYYIYST